MNCAKCGSDRTRPYKSKPPIGGSHKCTPECEQIGIFCLNCRFLQPRKEGNEMGREEVNEHEDGLVGSWTHDPNHEPWQETAPGWAVREFAVITDMVKAGKWYPPHPVGGLIDGHLVHCNGIWEDGELVCPPERDTYYEATVKMSDGTMSTLSLWREAGFRR